MNKTLRRVLIVVGVLVLAACAFFPWLYTSAQLRVARAQGVYETPEKGMHSLLEANYSPGAEIKVLYAGPNFRDGSRPYVWYVIAEVRAAVRADGSPLGRNGCDAPGSYFLQTREGWVHVSEGAFPEWISIWMDAFHMAGPVETAPSTNWAPGQSNRFCQ
jgi:hypothetical protein